ncbi:RTA1 like protein-domain-containing protein [Colletotrichum acutatum]|uniref:RTA1 like protein-domain-containing protein n=1 Tax=Glomerella acutata TaxID=27357 RepID=A0AAD8XJE9_GLOAC|nr:RTA1 like protein-domain-containing protein [Colletotrichum acutatum]KAK1726390.1 RTA1 like protein-domain-containing protein [Colletotrichum acutatum]
MLATLQPRADSGFKLYYYDPSFAAAVLFALLFGGLSIRHLILLIKTRTWCFIPFFVGCLFETLGYAARSYSAKQTPDWTLMPYVGQSMLILLGPAFYAASIYMVLGRLVTNLDANSYSLIRVKWLTKFFLMGDILSIFGQGGGGGLLATAKSESSQNMGNNVILLGLGIQVVFFGFFMIVTTVFQIRITLRPTTKSLHTQIPWQKFIWVLYFSSLLIMVRSIFRMVEYAQGHNGSLIQKEIYVYVLDALLMTVVSIVFSVFHPSIVLEDHGNLKEDEDFPLNGAHSYPLYGHGNISHA